MAAVRLFLKDAKSRAISVVVQRTGKSMQPPRENVNRTRETMRRRRQMERARLRREGKRK